MNISKVSFHMTVALILLVALPLALWAGTTGKIAGVVENKVTGEPIPGATIRVLGTEIATQTDSDGEYFIINLPAGTYELAVSIIGFQGIQKENVRVLIDLTTPVDFEVEQVEIPLARQVKVYAERAPIQKDLTSTRSTLTSDRMSFIPNSITVQNILSNMAGTVVDRNNNLHVRGGRAGQISYYYDGFSVQDPFVGRSGIRIMPDALEEINLTSGGFPAEYGEALSGVVNAVTKEGAQDFTGKVRFYDGYSTPFNIEKASFDDFQRTKNSAAGYDLSGPIPFLEKERATFFIAGEYIHDGGYLPHNKTKETVQSGKFNIQPSPDLKLTATGSYHRKWEELYTHRDVNDRSYDFNLDGLGIARSEAYLWGIKGNYNLSQRNILAFSYSHFHTESKQAPQHLFDTYWNQWPGYSEDSNGVYNGTIHEDNYQLSQDYFWTGFTSGDDFNPTYRMRSTTYDAVSANLTSQFNKYNQIRFGGEYRVYNIFWDFKQFFNIEPYGEKYDESPKYSMLYLQDKLELKDLIINAGLRWDYLNSEVDYWPNVLDTANNPRVRSKSQSQLSPRLGVSHPISDNSIIRFNYGYFFQAPNYTTMYTNLQANLNSGYPLVGNPALKAEKTVAYELGLSHMLSPDIRVDVTTYYKDIKDLISTEEIGLYGTTPVTQFINEDFGSVKGVDVTLEKISRGNLSGSLVYSYMIAKGNLSSAYDGYYDYVTDPENPVKPVKEFPLAFDQRHTMTVSVDYRVPRDWQGRLFGLTLPGAWGINMAGHYGSGLPYTVTDQSGRQEKDRLNEARLPANYSVDMRFNKDVYLGQKNLFFSFFVEVENLFNRRNIINVYTNTGRPDDDGRIYDLTSDPDGSGPYTAEDVNRYYRLMAKDPQNYSAPRIVRMGLEFNF
ncbi:MAG: TonB-dependent receptor [bacterium]